MAEKQTEGIIDTQLESHSPMQASKEQGIAKIENESQQEGITIIPQPQLAHFIQEENPNSPNVPRANNKPQIVREQDPPKVTPLHNLTENPTWIDCPSCKKRAMTRISKEGTTTQTVVGFLLCLCCICLSCLPCICGWYENTHIHCTSCGVRVATIPVDGPIQLAPIAHSRG